MKNKVDQQDNQDWMKYFIVNGGFLKWESTSKEFEVLVKTEDDELGTWGEGCHGGKDKMDDLDCREDFNKESGR